VTEGYFNFGETATQRDSQEMSVVQNVLNLLLIRITQRTENRL